MSTGYAEIRDGLLDVVGGLSQMNPDGGSARLGELAEKLRLEQFNLVVMGQFKRGKSTLINALIGAGILPTSILPLTSIVTILQFGETEKAVVHYLNDERREIGFDEIPKFVTERENPENKLGVKDVEVYYPSDFLKDGVRIIDTPGVGSVFQHNTDVAYSFLPYVDAGIFIVTSDPPMGEAEQNFLKNVREYAHKIFFALNKSDLVDPSDLAEAKHFTEDLIKKYMGYEAQLYPVSAKQALHAKMEKDAQKLERSGFAAFEKELQHFLHREKGEVFLQAVITALLKITADETMACQLEQKAAELSVQELKEKVAKFEDYARTTQKDRERQRFILDGQIKKLHALIDQDLDALQAGELPALLDKLEGEFAQTLSGRPSSHELEKKLEGYVFDQIKHIFSNFRSAESEKIAAVLETIYLEVAEQTNAAIADIVKMTADLFEVELNPFTRVEKLSSKSDFYFLLRDDPGAIELIGLSLRIALPVMVTKKMILKRVRSAVAERFERHCGRVRYDLVQRIERTTNGFRKQLNEKIEQTLATIRRALERSVTLKEQSEKAAASTMSDLTQRLSSVDQIRAALIDWQQKAGALEDPGPPAA